LRQAYIAIRRMTTLLATLSERELQVLELLCSGLSPKEIGGRLAISAWTVKNHIASARRRSGDRTTVQLAHRFGRERRARRKLMRRD
jgi:DNA-binding CsgD family transcriptional regulator